MVNLYTVLYIQIPNIYLELGEPICQLMELAFVHSSEVTEKDRFCPPSPPFMIGFQDFEYEIDWLRESSYEVMSQVLCPSKVMDPDGP